MPPKKIECIVLLLVGLVLYPVAMIQTGGCAPKHLWTLLASEIAVATALVLLAIYWPDKGGWQHG